MRHQPKPLLLIFPFGLLSHYLRCLALARHLSRYFIIKVAQHPQYSTFVEYEGYASFSHTGLNEDKVMQNVENFDFSWLNEHNLEMLFKEQVKVIDDLKPAAVLGDAMPTLKMAAEYTGVHYLSLINGYMSRYYAAERSLSRTHPAYQYVNKLPDLLKKYVTMAGEAIAFREVHRPFQKLRRKYGLSYQSHYLNEMEGDQTLICDLPELFPLKEVPAGFCTIGPLLYTAPAHVVDKPLQIDPAKKTIYVSMGSSGNWESVSFLNNSYYKKYNIIAAGDKQNLLNAQHVESVEFVNANDVLPAADLVICHGGNGTIYQALAYGVPLLCHTAHFEQEWNVAALKAAGLATSFNDITEADVRLLIEACIQEKQAEALHAINNKIKDEVDRLSDKIAAVADHILQLSADAVYADTLADNLIHQQK